MGAEGSKAGNSVDPGPECPLTKEELGKLDSSIREKLEKYDKEQKSLLDGLKISSDRYRNESESKISELEQKYKDDVSRLDADAKLATDLRLQTADLEKKYNDVSQKYREVQSKYFTKDQHWNEREITLVHDKELLQREKNDLFDLLAKRNAEIDRISEDYKQMLEKYNENNRQRISAETSAGEAKSELSILQHRESRLRAELDQLKEQHCVLTEQLNEATASVFNIRREKASAVIELQNNVDEALQQVRCLEQSLDECRKSQTDQSKQIETYAQKLRDARQSYSSMEERYRSELTAQERLINLYKSSSTDAEEKVEELTSAVKELQRLLGKSTDAYNLLEEEKNLELKELREEIESKDTRIEELDSELKNANVLLEASRKRPAVCLSDEEVEMISPAAAAASRMLKSGMTLTQIYSEYVSVAEELQTVKDENKHLSEELKNIVEVQRVENKSPAFSYLPAVPDIALEDEEVTEKAPIFKRLQKDYDHSCVTIAHLHRQHETAVQEMEKCRSDTEAAKRKTAEVSRENERLLKSLADSGLQVRLLLKELEESRGAVVSMSGDEGLDQSLNSSSAANLISAKLVTFRSIEELQRNNEKLLSVVRELSESQEVRENETANERAEQLQRELDKATEEIEELMAARKRQAEMVKSIIQQRDMYKEMAESKKSPRVETVLKTPPPVTMTTPVRAGLSEQDQQILEQTRKSLAELQQEFSTYRREKCENERILNEQLESTQHEASELRVKAAMLASQVEFSAERYKIQSSNMESRKKEVDVLRQRSEGLSEQVIKYQQTVTLLREETKSTMERLAQAEVRVESLLIERERLKSIEQRLNKELEDVRREQQSRDLLVSNLNTIQNNMERSDFELKMRFTQRIEALEKENTVLRKKADGTDEQQKAFVITLERQLSEARDASESERQKSTRLTEQLDTANSHIAHLQEELTRTEGLVASSEAKLETFKKQKAEGSSSIQELEDANKRLMTLQHELQVVQEKLDQTQQYVTQYKEIARGLEENLLQQNEASESYRQEKETEIALLNQAKESLEDVVRDMEGAQKQLQDENVSLNERTTALQQQIQALSEEKQQWNTNIQKSDTELSRQLEEARRELIELRERCETAVKREEEARQDCIAQANDAKQAIAKYERELVLHASDVEALTSLKQQMEGFNAKLLDAYNETEVARNAHTAAKEAWTEQESLLKRDLSNAQERLSGLISQNNVLHDELQQLIFTLVSKIEPDLDISLALSILESCIIQEKHLEHSMSEKMVQIQSKQNEDDTKTKELAESLEKEDQSKSSEKLQEVIRYLRREKEIAESKYDTIEAETNRLRQQVNYLKHQLEFSEAALNKEREAAQVNVQTSAQHAELMRKVETLNLLQDSNRLLRDDRNRSAEALQQAEQKISRLEVELAPLKEQNSDLRSERESLQQEIELLNKDIGQWKARTNQLIEQCNKTNPEEFKRALEERDQLKRQVNAASEEIKKLRNEVSRLGNQLSTVETSLTSELQELQEQKQRLETELEEANTQAKTVAETNEAENEEKNKTIAQLRKIGRKYRLQAEEVQKELDDLRAETSTQQAGNLAALQNQLKQAESSLQEAQAENEQYKNNAAALNAELESTKSMLANTQDQWNKLTQEQSKLSADVSQGAEEKKGLEERCNGLTGELSKLREEMQALNEDRERLNKEVTETQTKLTQMKNIFLPAKQKLSVQKAELDQLGVECAGLKERLEAESKEKEAIRAENEELKRKLAEDSNQSAEESELRLSSLRSQYEGRISRLEKDLAESKGQGQNSEAVTQLRAQLAREIEEKTAASENVEKMTRERVEMTQRMNLLQRQVETLQRQIDQSGVRAAQPLPASSAERTLVGSSEATTPLRRANVIRPISSPQSSVSSVRHPTPVRPVRSGVQGTPAPATGNLRSVDPRVSQSIPVQPVRTATVTSAAASQDEATAKQTLVQPVRTLPMSSSGGAGASAGANAGAAADGERSNQPGRMNVAEAWTAESRAAPVQPVRSGATETGRTMVASIRPMAASAQQQLQQQLFTPMATVMPTSINVQESEGVAGMSFVGAVQHGQQSTGQARPTQQVQPVSSQVEESTVSSSEEQWRRPTDPLIPSTSRSALTDPPSVSTAGPSGASLASAKRQREEIRPIQDESVETESEAPVKRSKIQMSEVSDTTQTSGAAVVEMDREALSVAEQHQDSGRRASHEGNSRRETEPVSTSLSGMDDQQPRMEHSIKLTTPQAAAEGYVPSGDDLPDYQEPEASEPSTSLERDGGVVEVDELSNQGSGGHSEAAANRTEEDHSNSDSARMSEDNNEIYEERSGVESGAVVRGEDDNDDVDDDDEGEEGEGHDVHFIDDDEGDDDDDDDDDVGTGYKRGVRNVGEEEEEEEDIYGDMGSETGQGDEASGDPEAQQHDDDDDDDEDDDDDVIILDDEGQQTGSAQSTAESFTQGQGQSVAAGSSVVRSAAEVTAVRPGVVQQRTAVISQGRISPNSLVGTSRAQLMPFLFGHGDVGGSSGFEFGDDGIVPSTPTLQIPARNDGFAEAISSPHIREPFIFTSASEVIPQSELVHQGGVDVTRMDLSQFDPPGTSSISTDVLSGAARRDASVTQSGASAVPRITVTDVTPASGAETGAAVSEEREEEEEEELLQGYEEGREEEEEEEEGGEREAEAEGQTSSSGYHTFTSGQEDQPSTSEASASASTASAKPKIQKIVWGESDQGGAQATQSSAVTPIRRGFRGRGSPRDSSRPYRGSGAVRPFMPQQQMPQQPQAHPPSMVARRSRGNRGASWTGRQQHF